MKNIDSLELTKIIRNIYGDSNKEFIPLHEPRFISDEKELINKCIDSTYVSTIGEFVPIFEDSIKKYTGAKHAIATSNGTSALHLALIAAGVSYGEEVLTQSFTFVATCNAIKYCNAEPVFVDISRETLGMCPKSLRNWLESNSQKKDAKLYNKITGSRIAAILPMHTFGNSCDIKILSDIAEEFGIPLIEDAAEALGSKFMKKHLGTYGDMGTLSFNGNKIITTGGGGAVVTNNDSYAKKIRHIATTARSQLNYEFVHDEIGYNYRMPNLNACLGVSQMKKIDFYVNEKRKVAKYYKECFKNSNIDFFNETPNSLSNYWLNSIIFENKILRDNALKFTNENSIMTRPPWKLMSKLPMFNNCQRANLINSEDLESRILNIPSSVPLAK